MELLKPTMEAYSRLEKNLKFGLTKCLNPIPHGLWDGRASHGGGGKITPLPKTCNNYARELKFSPQVDTTLNFQKKIVSCFLSAFFLMTSAFLVMTS